MKNFLPLLILPAIILSACGAAPSQIEVNENTDVTTQTPSESSGTEAPLIGAEVVGQIEDIPADPQVAASGGTMSGAAVVGAPAPSIEATAQ